MDRATDLSRDAVEVLTTLSRPMVAWLAFGGRIPGRDSDGVLLAVLLGVPQDQLKLRVNRLPIFARVPLRPAGKLDHRIRHRVPLYLVQAINEQAYGFAVFAVVIQQGLPETLVARRLPPVSPHQAL